MTALVRNVGLPASATEKVTSSIDEPTAAAHLNQLMMTGNWWAATSVDTGTTWTHVDPFTRFPSAAGGFCCDQIVLFDQSHQIWIWLMQYVATPGGNNIFRIAISRAASFGNWYYWDFAPTGLNPTWTTTWFDYPDMALTSTNLYVTFNAFVGNAWQRAIVFRFPLATLAAGTALGYNWWSTTNNGSLRLCHGATNTMHFGSHNSGSRDSRV